MYIYFYENSIFGSTTAWIKEMKKTEMLYIKKKHVCCIIQVVQKVSFGISVSALPKPCVYNYV